MPHFVQSGSEGDFLSRAQSVDQDSSEEQTSL